MPYSMSYRYLSTERNPILSACRQGLEGFPSSSLKQEILLPIDINEESHTVSSKQMSTAWCGCLQGIWAETTYYLHPVISLKTKMHLLLCKVIRNFRSVLHKHQETYDTFSNTEREVLSTQGKGNQADINSSAGPRFPVATVTPCLHLWPCMHP